MALTRCPRCDGSLVEGALYCQHCGALLAELPPAAEQAPDRTAPEEEAPQPQWAPPTEGATIESLDPLNAARALRSYQRGVQLAAHWRFRESLTHLERAGALAPGDERVQLSLLEIRRRVGAQPPEPKPATPLGPTSLAPPGRRIAGLSLDLFLFVVVALVLTAVLGTALEEDDQSSRRETLNAIAVVASVLAVFVLYFWWGCASGRTIGCRVSNCRIVDEWRLERPGAWRGLVRAAALLVSLIPLGLGALWALWDRQGQTWHDAIAGTRVLLDEKPGSGAFSEEFGNR